MKIDQSRAVTYVFAVAFVVLPVLVAFAVLPSTFDARLKQPSTS